MFVREYDKYCNGEKYKNLKLKRRPMNVRTEKSDELKITIYHVWTK